MILSRIARILIQYMRKREGETEERDGKRELPEREQLSKVEGRKQDRNRDTHPY